MANLIPTLSTKHRSAALYRSFRTRAGFIAEADVAAQAMSTKRFARASEGAECDGAILIDVGNADAIPDDMTERYYALSNRYKGKMLPNAVLIDIKSFQWTGLRHKVKLKTKGRDIYKVCSAQIHMTDGQIRNCQVLVIASLLDPNFVAVVPKPYFRFQAGTVLLLVLGLSVPPAIAEACPFPPELSPFIMPASSLATALESIAIHASDGSHELRNPFTDLLWQRCSDWQVTRSRFDDVLPSSSATEFKIRQQFWQAFQSHSTDYHAKSPHYAPITSDIRLDHSSGVSIFVEIKLNAIKVVEVSTGAVRLEHCCRTRGNTGFGIFTFKAWSWDYLLSIPSATSATAFLIKRDDWPRLFWHCEPPLDAWLSHEFSDGDFLDARKVRLNAGHAALVNDVVNIISRSGEPEPATLTVEEVLQFAGPCPISLLKSRGQQTTGINLLETLDGFDDDSSEEEVPNDEQEEEAATENNDESTTIIEQAGTPAWKGRLFATTPTPARYVIMGGHEMNRVAQLFELLMDESRITGQGCPIFLGNRHPFGPIGFVRYRWSDKDKQVFDEIALPPVWVGNVTNETPMVTLIQQYTRWRVDYAPREGTRLEIEAMRLADPCLVVCQNFAREIAHLQQQVWLVPSEFLPKVSLGYLKADHDQDKAIKGPIFLTNRKSIDAFNMGIALLHAKISEFLMGGNGVDFGVGLDEVRVDPNRYLKTFREYRISSEVNWERIFSPRNEVDEADEGN